MLERVKKLNKMVHKKNSFYDLNLFGLGINDLFIILTVFAFVAFYIFFMRYLEKSDKETNNDIEGENNPF